MPKTLRIPQYRCHKPTGQAVLTLSGKDHYMGVWKTAASKAESNRLIGEWLAAGRCLSQGLPRRQCLPQPLRLSIPEHRKSPSYRDLR